MRRVTLAAVLALCLGCGSPAAPADVGRARVSPVATIEHGMAAARVAAALGDPDRVEQIGGREPVECWYYANGAVVVLVGGAVQFAGWAGAGP
jgi:hypothetical protein